MINVKVGDEVTRMIGGTTPMQLIVSEVTETEIICGPWRFNRETGGEIDEDIGWDGVRITGSIIKPNKNNMDQASLGWMLALDDAACRIRFSLQFNAFVREVDRAYPANKMNMAAMADLYVRSTFEALKQGRP